jgi:hypothetical protein
MSNPEELRAIYEEYVESFRLYLQGHGLPPDLSEAPPELRENLEKTFLLLEAITGASDELLPSMERVAARLGLDLSSDVDVVVREAGVQTQDLMAELVELEGPGVELRQITEARTTTKLCLVAEYRQLGLVVGVCLVGGAREDLWTDSVLREADAVFRSGRHTALALVATDPDLSTIVVPPEDCTAALLPSQGVVPPGTTATALPMLMAIHRYLEFVDPVWDDVPVGLAEAAGFDVKDAASQAASEALQAVVKLRTTVPEKREALDSFSDKEMSWLSGLPTALVARRLKSDDVAREIDKVAEASAS